MSGKQLKTNLSSLQGEISIPGDKSISHRAVMFGAMAEGKTTINHFLAGEDCLSTISCFEKMGVSIKREDEYVEVEGKGIEGLSEPASILDVGNSGTTTRLMLGILAGVPFHTSLIGDESIAKRPMSRVTVPLRSMGAKIDGREHGQYTPLSTRGGALKAIHYHSPVASAQVKSAILLAGLHAEGTTKVTEPFTSRDHTERMLRAFGVDVEVDGTTVSIEGGQSLRGTDVYVPGDISSAAFFLVAGAIVPNSRIVLKNVGLNPTRTGIIDVLQQMGARLTISNERIQNGEPIGDLTIETSQLKGIEIGGDVIPRLIDEIPVIALLATQANGKTVIKDAEELKVKETNRIDTVATELSKLGASVTPTADGLIIEGKTALKSGEVDSYGDHRIGMMLAVAAAIATGEVTLMRSEAIHVSYPTFFEDLDKLSE
ncbi:3-phosphoshikimate 1-carboxyvinyltransferase [Priestia megaterium]|uniref:3-phosphoshikimate 1-carboxyvinyltransferase n=1 Tax=Priestia megaterium (strain ATCC 14581 / DSM 32 / CCUG 1817 / JCM 2506 / NBRC 15308 / NCIMB 9376 / NCTC 10342 / NRRL B-14308 / VKM B-512 / Ford 19) TaxID=1348623 RepID=A0A0B6AIK1_PRIM2|nr:3-phosphoshikimate 1-carboxyvinyltransferase [Priestia megaterium]AJI24720.1 3-phosphoshikimate 1-carboxyvinyltransferase AroA [Priestia megaterium NBRC 15308 = ATCC 14581]KFN00796.1 3-phosphoshikimate 1-carboxyvinyltransferase [Priestia megaterium]KGJ73028.1 3-phosphoshikimate 1-carboxyvinyltransferase [Priestia megaterium NBRC 15308 = ATCC 14581]MDH3185083.1 3-phosphoshikimate 1-carboxyvinyltransferase [Priestia megaterium]MDQ0806997.1 3-phosphoshikimate 1-carboxyvinyltransferase [Priesti